MEYVQTGAKLSKKEFYKHPNLANYRKGIRGSAIILYVCAAITLLAGLATYNLFSIIDVVVIVGLALNIQFNQSRAAAVILCIYSLINVIVALLTTGSIGGWLIIIAAIIATIYTFCFKTLWKEYQKTGLIPAGK